MYADQFSASFKKPTKEMNIASGCVKFISQAQLTDAHCGYLVNDAFYIKSVNQHYQRFNRRMSNVSSVIMNLLKELS